MEIVYSIDQVQSDQQSLLVITLEQGELKHAFLELAPLVKPCPFALLLSLARHENDKKALTYLCQKELLYQKKVTGRLASLENSSFLQIHLSYSHAIDTLKLLAATGKLYLNGRALACDFFGLLDFYYQVDEHPDQIDQFQVKGMVKWDEEPMALTACDFVCGGHPAWLVKGIQLKLLATEVSEKELKACHQDNFFVTAKELEELIQDHQENAACPLVLLTAEATRHKDNLALPTPFLQLKDSAGIFADLWFDYHGIKLPYHTLLTKTAVKRDLVAERAWEKDLLESDFRRKESAQGHYYCPTHQVTKSLTFLLEIGWQLYDWQQRAIIHHTSIDLTIQTQGEKIAIKGKIHYADLETDLTTVLSAFNRRESFIALTSQKVALIPQNLTQSALSTLWQEGEIVQDAIHTTKNRLGLLADLHQVANHFSLDESLQQLTTALSTFQDITRQLPAHCFKGTLRPYQQKGVDWLKFLYTYHLHGLLADDMGLGKTVQVLAFLSTLAAKEPTLIILPASLLFNWKNEIATFLPDQTVLSYHGADKEGQRDKFSQYDYILVSYTTLRLEADFFCKLSFHCVILDEAQMIKNSQAQVSQAIYALSARFRLSITGTPIENHSGELWSQFHFLMPDLLGEEASFIAQTQAAQVDSRHLKLLRKKIRPFILRRKKEEVAPELPEKIEQVVWIEQEEEQRLFYENFLAGIKKNLLPKVALDGVSQKRVEILEAILRLRQICCHPLLVAAKISANPLTTSSKLQMLLQDLESIALEGKKALIYSQFSSMLTLIAKALTEKGSVFAYLDGNTKDRQAAVYQFQQNADCPFFLISLKAGGFGLNLTAADYVLLYDPWWNDAVEEQAIARAHRIGRQHTVICKRYIIKETIEEKIMQLKQAKRSVVGNFFEEEGLNGSITAEDLSFLLS